MKLFFIFYALILVGCGSTPYRDDYTSHVNLLNNKYLMDTNIKFSFAKNINIDLRGVSAQNDTVSASPILYQGGAGLIGMLAQVGTHASLINANRDGTLANAQKEANKKILPLINLLNGVANSELLDDEALQANNLIGAKFYTINLKPIFFSDSKMTEFSLTLIVSLPLNEKLQKRKNKFKYKNMIKVYSHKLNEFEQKKIVNGDKQFLTELLSSLLNTAMYITKSALTGKFASVNNPAQTFIINQDSGSEVIRGSLVMNKCGYQIIKDLHSWYIAYPKPDELISYNNDYIVQCL